jgi:hypothetical protein
MGSLMDFSRERNEIGMAFGNLEIVAGSVTCQKPTWYQWRLRWESPDLLVSWSTDLFEKSSGRVRYSVFI